MNMFFHLIEAEVLFAPATFNKRHNFAEILFTCQVLASAEELSFVSRFQCARIYQYEKNGPASPMATTKVMSRAVHFGRQICLNQVDASVGRGNCLQRYLATTQCYNFKVKSRGILIAIILGYNLNLLLPSSSFKLFDIRLPNS